MRNPQLTDTHPDVKRWQLAWMRQAPSWRKAHMLGQLPETMKQLALSGLRQRHPEADKMELRRRLADLLLGPDLAAKAYGPLPGAEPDDGG
jgi:hypothetical protein